MLPTRGIFKDISCPFHDIGLCERPYCHFRHKKKVSSSSADDGIGTILQKLVTSAVQIVLKQAQSSGNNNVSVIENSHKAKYNLTPILEESKIICTESVNSEDIDVQRRCVSVPQAPRKLVKRDVGINDVKHFVYNPPSVNIGTDKIALDHYTDKRGLESSVIYLANTEKELREYSFKVNSNKLSSISLDSKKILENKPVKVTFKNEHPESCSSIPVQCVSCDEEKPESKKRKMSTDLSGLDELSAEFDILDEILHDEMSHDNNKDSICQNNDVDSTTTDEVKSEIKFIHNGVEFDILDEILSDEMSHENINKDSICPINEKFTTIDEVKSVKECFSDAETKILEKRDAKKFEHGDIESIAKSDFKKFEHGDIKHKDIKISDMKLKSPYNGSCKDKTQEKAEKRTNDKRNYGNPKSSPRSSKESEGSSSKDLNLKNNNRSGRYLEKDKSHSSSYAWADSKLVRCCFCKRYDHQIIGCQKFWKIFKSINQSIPSGPEKNKLVA